MAFWWQRRKRWWRGRYRPLYRRKRKTYRRKRRFRRRPHRRTYRRRRRGRKKVRRKLKKIKIAQWQPDTIRKCKIKGIAVNCLGGHGKQFQCYTNTRFDWVPATAPGGGGFGCEIYTLDYLFKEYQRGNNTWSTSNEFLDLVRYTGCTFRFFRHRYIDFIVEYNLMYPMKLDKYTYPYCHPFEMLKHKHHKVIPSWKTKPFGKRSIKIKIKPPKQMTTTWNFQHTFADKPLLQLNTAAADLNFSYLGCCNTNRLMTFYALNEDIYKYNGWGNKTIWGTHGYQPYDAAPTTRTSFVGYNLQGQKITGTLDPTTWENSVSYDTGWFNPKFLQIVRFSPSEGDYHQNNVPIRAGRYNPSLDTGVGNAVWVVDILNKQFIKPTHDKLIIIEELPLWQALYGIIDYIEKIKGDQTILQTGLLVIQSPYIYPKLGKDSYWVIIDKTFIKGEGPYSEYVTTTDKKKWYPDIWQQQQTINNFVQTGPYIPKLDNQRDSTWELKSRYDFYFKWGGAQQPNAEAADPSKQDTYAPPGMQSETIQVSDPSKQIPSGILHTWDFRRGIVTRKALKRMLQDQTTITSIQTDAETPSPKKKKYSENTLQTQTEENKKMQRCLQQLFEESTSQDSEETQDLKQLIKHQKQQQQNLKIQLLQLISNLRLKQQALQLHTGVQD